MELTSAGGSGGRGRSAAAGANETERKQRLIRESLLMTLGSALIFIESVSMLGGGLLCTLQERPDKLEDG